MASEIRDKDGVPIHVGDQVRTKTRRGQVYAVFTDSASTPVEKADDLEITAPIKHTPKVVLLDKNGRQVAHNPSVLRHTTSDSGERSEKAQTSDNDYLNSAKEMKSQTQSMGNDGDHTIQGKDGLPIHVGETVMTPYRGGRHQGEVEAIFIDSTVSPVEEQPDHSVHVAVAHPPKVVFTTERNKQVAHNPSALEHVG